MKLLLTMKTVEANDKNCDSTYQLLKVQVRVRVRVLCRVRVSVSFRSGGSFLLDKGILMLAEGKIRVNKYLGIIISRTALLIFCVDCRHRKE